MTTIGRHIQAAIEPINTQPDATIRRFTRRDSLAKTVNIHTRLWEFYDHIPEIHYWVGVASNITRMLHYFPGVVTNDVESNEPERDDNADVLALWDDIGGEQRMREMIAELVAHRRVVGDAYIVPLNDRGELFDPADADVDNRVTWDVVSSIELRRLVGIDIGAEINVDVPAWRVWKRHPRDANHPDPPLASVKSQCEALIALDGRVLADSRARLSAGVLFLPDSLTSVVTESGRSWDEELESAILDPVTTPDSSDTVAPLVAYIRPDEIDAVRHVTFGREQIADAIAQREELIRRIAAGLDAPAELLLGMGDLNHWSAWLVQDSTYTQHIDPDVVDVLDDLSVWWRSLLRSAGITDTENRVLWRDPNPALRRPDRLDDVLTAFDRFAASRVALRDAAGLTESDAPTEEEIEERIRIAQLATPLALAQGGGSDISAPSDGDGATDTGPPESANPSDGDAPPETASPRWRPAVVLAANDDRTRSIASGLTIVDRTALSTIDRVAERQIRRARARAIDRIVADAQHTPGFNITTNGTSTRDVFDTLTPDQIRAIAGDDAAVSIDDFDPTAITAVLVAAETERVDVLQSNDVDTDPLADPDDDINAATRLIVAALFGAAVASVLGSRPDPDTPGEIPDTDIIVPMTDIRRGMTVAGGTPTTDVPPTSASDSNLIGNGQRSIDDLARAGLATVAYEWVYGDIPRRPFPPHRQMDGIQFASFDDDVLTPPAGGQWLGSRMFPGDHKGCRCTYRRVLEPVAPIAASTTHG